MATCSNCRRLVDETHPGTMEDSVVVRLCDECMDDLVGDKEEKRLSFGG